MIVVGTLTGAFGAHALDGVLPEQSMGSFEVASSPLAQIRDKSVLPEFVCSLFV